MNDKESRRSVLPNGQLIDTLRKRNGWTIEDFAAESRLGLRTIQKAISGRPISMESLALLADCLRVAYTTLLLIEEALAPKPSLLPTTEATTDFSLTLTMRGSLSDGTNLKGLLTLSPSIIASLAQAGITISAYDSKLQINERVGPDMTRAIMLIYGILDNGGPFWVFAAVMPSRYKAFKAAMTSNALNLYYFDPYGEIITSGEGKDPPPEVVLKVAKMYDTTPDHLMTLVDDPVDYRN